MSIERRFLQGEVMQRAEGTQQKFGGLALRFGVPYDMGWFTEEVSRDAFAKADMLDVVALFNHDPNVVLGRTSAGTLMVSITEEGLLYEFVSPDSPNGQNVAEAIRRGDVKQSSWGFTISGDRWELRNGKDHRIITGVSRVWDVSPVTFPANPDTTLAKRSREAAQAEKPSLGGLNYYDATLSFRKRQMQ